MNTIIKLRCIDQVLTFESTPVVASGGLEEERLVVEFCGKWDGMTKTAVFWRTEDEAYHVVLDDDDSCTVPPEVLTEAGVFFFGLFGVSAEGRRRTSQVMRYNVVQGVITAGTQPSNPTPEFWDQVLAMCQDIVDQAAEVKQSEAEFVQAMTAQQIAHEQKVDEQVEAIDEVVRGLAEQGYIGTEQLKDDAVTTAKIKDGAVTAEKIPDGTVSQQKLAPGLQAALSSFMQKSGGTFTGQVAAAASGQAPSEYLLRNTMLSMTEETPTTNGQICWQCK